MYNLKIYLSCKLKPLNFFIHTACNSGFYGPLCDLPCPPGAFGKNCGGVCSPTCPDEICDRIHGCYENTEGIISIHFLSILLCIY